MAFAIISLEYNEVDFSGVRMMDVLVMHKSFHSEKHAPDDSHLIKLND